LRKSLAPYREALGSEIPWFSKEDRLILFLGDDLVLGFVPSLSTLDESLRDRSGGVGLKRVIWCCGKI
jgi:hypothetical protein